MLGFSVGQSIVSWLLKKYVGKYVEDIDSRVKDFQYGLTGANLVLDNLNLKAEALVGLDLPIEVKAGHIGLLELTIPGITSIYTEPLVVKIDKVLLVASPLCDRQYDEVKDQALEQARKRETLDKLEQLLQQEHPENDEKDLITDPGFLETIKITVLQNIRVEITNIHIRYEDGITNNKNPFAFGITLQELSLKPSNCKQSNQSLSYVNKLLHLEELCVYWNCLLSSEHLLKNKLEDSNTDWKTEMYHSIEDTHMLGVDFDYLVEPINGSADLVINTRKKSKDPMISCKGCFKSIIINVKRHMFLNAIILKDSFAMMRVNEKYRKYHPGVPCLGNSRSWWLYAYVSIKEEVVKPKVEFWSRIWEYRRTYKAYRDLYIEKLLSPSASNPDELHDYEMILNIESIVMARKEAEKQYLAKKPSMAVVKPSNEGMISKLSNWWYGNTESTSVVVHARRSSIANDDFLTGLSDSDKRELQKAFNYSKEDVLPTTIDSTYVKYLLDVKFEGIQLNLLIDTRSKPVHVASLYVTDITGYLAVRVQGLKFASSIKHMEIFNTTVSTRTIHLAKVDATSHPNPSASQGADSSSLLSLTVEQYPTDVEADVSIKISTLPIHLVYDHDVACAVMAFLYVPVPRFNIGAQLRHLTPEFSTAGLQYAIDNHQRVYVEATLHSPYLVIPTNGLSYSNKCGKLIVDLGVLRVTTQLRPKNTRLENNSLEEREKLIYDKYLLDVQEVKIIYAPTAKDNWSEKRCLSNSDLHLMPSLNLSTTVSLSAEPNFRKLPKFKVDSRLESLKIKLSKSLIEPLLTSAYSFPQPSAMEFFDKYRPKESAASGSTSGYSTHLYNCGAGGLSAAGSLITSNLQDKSSDIFDEVDFNKLQRLEEKNIFVTEGDLLNLWFLLSKENTTNKGDSADGRRRSSSHLNHRQGLNAVADLLLQPQVSNDGKDSVSIRNYATREISSEDDEEFVLAPDEDPSSGLALPGLRGYTGTDFHTLAYTNFTIDEMSVNLLTGIQDYLTIAVSGVTGQACRTTCCVSVRVKLNSFSITDHLHLDVNRQKLHIARSPESLSMASFEGQFIDDVANISFTDVSKSMTFDLSTIQLCVQDESTSQIISMVAKINKLLNVLQKSNQPRDSRDSRSLPSSGGESTLSLRTAFTENDIFYDTVSKFDTESLLSKRSLSKRSIDSISSAQRRQSQARRKSVRGVQRRAVDAVDLHIRCTLKSLTLELQREFTIITKLAVSDVSGEYELRKTHWTLDAKLGTVSLLDPMASIYKQVVVVEEGLKEVMILRVTSFDQSVKQNESCDQKIEVTLRRMRLIYINKFISRLTNFFGQFSSRSTIDQVQETSRNRISSTAKSAHKTGTRTLISVEARTPLIIVPESDESYSALLLRLGDLQVTNEFVTEQVKGKAVITYQVYDVMTVTLDNIAIEGIKYLNEQKYIRNRDLLTPITTNLILKRALPPVTKRVVDFYIEANINQFTMEVSQLDLQMVGRVIYQNLMVDDQLPQSYVHSSLHVTDVGSTISSALSSTASSSSPTAKALTISLTLGGAILHLKREDPNANALESLSQSLAKMDVAELKIEFCKGKADSTISCLVTLRNFAIEDLNTSALNEFSTNSVIELEEGVEGVHEILLIKYDLEASGNSTIFCTVQKMKFNVNLPFVKSVVIFIQESFTTWKSGDTPPPTQQHLRRQRPVAPRRRKFNTTDVNHRLSVSAKRLSPPPRPPRRLSGPVNGTTKPTKMIIDLTFGKQSLYMASSDGSQKALVAELDIQGKADIASHGSIEAHLNLNDLAVYTTSLRSEESHLKHQCLKPCSVKINYQSLSPMSQFKTKIPPKVEVSVTLTKIDIRLSTNLVYHTLDALALFKGDDTTDDTSATGFQTNEVDLNAMKEIDTEQWFEQYDQDDNFQYVEMNPMQAAAAVECLTVKEFDLDIEFSVAIGEEFVAILRTHSDLSASVKDWSTKPRGECCFSLECKYYNEILDVWEPLIEPMFDGETGKYRRWEILARLTTAPSHPIARTDPSEILLNCQELDTFIHHQMSSAKEKQKAAETAALAALSDNSAARLGPSVDEVDQMGSSDMDEEEDDNFRGGLMAAGAISLQNEHSSKEGGKKSGLSRMPSVIVEEEDEDKIDEGTKPPPRSMLRSAGAYVELPALFVTQPSHDEQERKDSLDGLPVPSVCHSLEDRDPEKVEVTVDKKGPSLEVMCTYLSLVSRDRLLLNVSPQGMNVVTSVIDTFTKKPKDSTLFEVSKSHALTITNCLGIPACISLHRATKRTQDVKLENVRIAENMDVSDRSNSVQEQPGSLYGSEDNLSNNPLRTLAKLTLPKKEKKAAGAAQPAQVVLTRQTLHLAVDGYLPITNISFRRIQSRDFNAKARDKRRNPLCLRVRTQSKHGKKHIYIYSQLKVKNELQYPVEISYQEIAHDELHNRHVPTNNSLGTIEPGTMLNIPAAVAQQRKLHVKPVTTDTTASGEYGESNESLWWKAHTKSKSPLGISSIRRMQMESCEYLTCANQLQQTFTFKAVWIARRCLAEGCQGDCPSFDVILKPTAEIKNFLPFEIKLEVPVNSSAVGTQPSVYSLEPGGNKQIHDSISSPKRVSLVIPEYQATSWRGSFDVHDKMSENHVTPVTLASEMDYSAARGSMTLDRKPVTNSPLTVTCNVTRVQSSNCSQGQLQITFFSSYWISNTTGRMLQFKAAGIGGRYVETTTPYPILFTPSSMKKKMQLRLPGYKWSKSFAVDAAGTVGGVSCCNAAGTVKQRFMVETTLSNTQLTKIITVFPMFVVLNKTDHRLLFKESVTSSSSAVAAVSTDAEHINADCVEDEDEEECDSGLLPALRSLANVWVTVNPGETKPFWPARRKKPISMVVKTEGSAETTHSFPADVPQRTLLPVSGQNAVTADVSGGLGTEYFITLRPYQLGDAEVRIENLTAHLLLFSQGPMLAGNTLSVPCSTTWLYYWPNPSAIRKLYWLIPDLNTKPILAQFTQDCSGEVKLNGTTFFWQSYGDNLQRVLTFSDDSRFQQIIEKKNQKEQATVFVFSALQAVSVSFINSESLELALLTVNQSAANWSVMPDGQTKSYDLGDKLSSVIEKAYCNCSSQSQFENGDIEIDFSHLRFVRPIQGLLKRESYPGIKFQYQRSEFSLAIQASVNYLQIDNQLPDAFFPVVFHPTHPGYLDVVSSKTKPCLGMFARVQFPIDGTADTYKRVVVDIEQFSLRLDKGFMLSFFDFITSCRKTEAMNQNALMKSYHEEDVKYCLTDLATDTVQKTDKSSGAKIYVENLHISSIKVRLSFSMAGKSHLTNIENTQSTFGGDVVDFLLRSIGMTLTEVTDIEFSLGDFTMTCAILTTSQLSSDATTFYKSQAIRQAYVFVLGLDIIGNPLGLVKDVQRGLEDFFSNADPLNFSNRKSLTRGIQSAYGNIVGGLCGAGSKITESIGKGVNVLTFDKRFQKARLRAMRTQPSHFPGSMLLSVKTFGKAVVSGFAGIVIQPKRGVEKQGAKGFFKGVGKGVSGVLVKPVGGVFDSTSVLLDGFRRVTQCDTYTVDRWRLPRHTIPSEGIAKYHPYLAEGVDILNDMTCYSYSPDDVYWSHLLLRRENKHQHIALASTKNVYLLYKPFYSSNLSTHWSIPVADIEAVASSKTSSETSSGQTLTLTRISRPGEEKILQSENKDELDWFHKRLNILLMYIKVTYNST